MKTKILGLFFLLGCLPLVVAAAEPVRCSKPLDSCIAEKRKVFEKRGEIGLLFSEPLPQDIPRPGARYAVCGILTGGPADRAGARMGDFLLAMNGKELATVSLPQLLAMHEEIRAGQTVTY